jgi:hypothetical protein
MSENLDTQAGIGASSYVGYVSENLDTQAGIGASYVGYVSENLDTPNIARGLKGQVATVVDPRYDALIQSHVSRSSDKNPT